MNKYFNRFTLLRDFVRFYFEASTIHTLDSPLLYKFCNDVLDTKLGSKLSNTKAYIAHCNKNKNLIPTINFGEPSKQSVNDVVNVNHIVNSASSNLYKCRYLINIAHWANPETILELGTNLGIASSSLSESGYKVTTVEGNEALAKLATLELKKYPDTNVICNSFETFLDRDNNNYDMIIIDGDHSYNATTMLIDKCQSHLNPEGIILIDDIRWSDGMKKAWNEVKSAKGYNLCIDLFMIGIISNKRRIKAKIDMKLIPRRYKPWPYHFFRKV